MLRLCVQACGIGLQQGRHLVDKGARAAGTDAVHAFLQAAGEIDDLGILTAQLDCHIRLRIEGFQRPGNGHDLLHEANAHGLGQGDRAGTRDPRLQRTVSQLFPNIL